MYLPFIVIYKSCVFSILQISEQLRAHFSESAHRAQPSAKGKIKMRRSASTRINEGVKALALCHNVTPVFEEEDGDASAAEAEQQSAAAATRTVTYQGRYSVLL